MANRSYLYATDHLPGSPGYTSDTHPIGVSEWSSAIAFVYKLLLSPAPTVCASPIDPTVKTAICGPYEEGVKCFKDFTSKIDSSTAEPLIQEALQFLEDNASTREYFLLECVEIFDFEPEPHEVQVSTLLQELNAFEDAIGTRIASLKTAAEQSDSALLEAMHNLGFGYWSRTLYFDLSEQLRTQEFVEDEALSRQWLAEQEQKERDFLAHFSCQIEVIEGESLTQPLDQLLIYIDGNVHQTRPNDDKPPHGELIRVEPGEHRIIIREPFDQTKERRLESNTLHFSLRKGCAVRFVLTSPTEGLALAQQGNIFRAERRRKLSGLIAIAKRIPGIWSDAPEHKD